VVVHRGVHAVELERLINDRVGTVVRDAIGIVRRCAVAPEEVHPAVAVARIGTVAKLRGR